VIYFIQRHLYAI